MIYARASGKVTRAPSGGTKHASAGVTCCTSGEYLRINAIATGSLAADLLRLQLGELVAISGPIQPRVFVNEKDTARVTFDINVRAIEKPSAARKNGS